MTLHHVALECRREDADAELVFWMLCGFAEVAPPASLGERARWVQRGATQIHLLFADEPRQAGHVAIVAEPFPEVVFGLRAGGFEVESRTPHWGAPRAYVTTPAGHTVELMAAPPA